MSSTHTITFNIISITISNSKSFIKKSSLGIINKYHVSHLVILHVYTPIATSNIIPISITTMPTNCLINDLKAIYGPGNHLCTSNLIFVTICDSFSHVTEIKYY